MVNFTDFPITVHEVWIRIIFHDPWCGPWCETETPLFRMLDSWQVIGISVGLDPQSPKRNADLIDGMRTWKTSFEQPWMSPRKSTHVFSKRDHFQKDFEKYPTHPAATPPSIWALVSHPGGWAKKDLGAPPNFIQPWSSGHFGSGVFVKTRSLRELIYNPDGYFHHIFPSRGSLSSIQPWPFSEPLTGGSTISFGWSAVCENEERCGRARHPGRVAGGSGTCRGGCKKYGSMDFFHWGRV